MLLVKWGSHIELRLKLTVLPTNAGIVKDVWKGKIKHFSSLSISRLGREAAAPSYAVKIQLKRSCFWSDVILIAQVRVWGEPILMLYRKINIQ